MAPPHFDTVGELLLGLSNQSREPRGPCFGKRLSSQPCEDVSQIQSGCNNQALEVRFLHASIATSAHPKRSDALSEIVPSIPDLAR